VTAKKGPTGESSTAKSAKKKSLKMKTEGQAPGKTGKILWYNAMKGRGAIRGDDGQDYFVFWKSFAGYETKVPDPATDARVTFESEEHDGVMMAVRVVMTGA